MDQPKQRKWCAACGSPVRKGAGDHYYHVVPRYPEYETIARETSDVQVKSGRTGKPVLSLTGRFN